MSDAALTLLAERQQLDSDFSARRVGPLRYASEAGRIQRQWDALPASERQS